MIVVGILSIFFGIVLAIWTFIQTKSDIMSMSAEAIQKSKDYVYVEFLKRKAENPTDDMFRKFEEFSRNNGFEVEGVSKSITNGLFIVSALMIVVGILCVIGYHTFDKKRKGVIKETAVIRFNEGKKMFIIGIAMAAVGLVGCIYSWLQISSLTYALQSEVTVWNSFVDKAIRLEFADPSWASWLKADLATVLNDFNAGSEMNVTMLNAIQIVSVLLVVIGAILFTSVVGKACKTKLFPVFNGIILIILTLIIIVPMYKVIVDSFDAVAGNGIYLLPQKFTLKAYEDIVTQSYVYRPFIISVITTLAGTLLGLTLSTLGAYVLIQFDMPGRNFFAFMLLFTMIFQGGMIPTFLVMKNLGLTNTLWSVILPLGMNVYNLVLMRNFFEGIPGSLFEAAQIDGCTPMQIFIKVVLPLSKAAIASIGLMFAVAFWNDYTNFKLYITERKLYNFQMQLRSLFDEGGAVLSEYYVDTTIQSATVIVAILPFMIIYPFCQNYFVQGVNVGAVKE